MIILLTPRRHEETMESIELMGKEVLPDSSSGTKRRSPTTQSG